MRILKNINLTNSSYQRIFLRSYIKELKAKNKSKSSNKSYTSNLVEKYKNYNECLVKLVKYLLIVKLSLVNFFYAMF